ncbi:SAM-dependent methyltransferase [Bythopirellula polymerisocia]|uniref:Cyclopropane-fatty-acyl-phospholipid synthase n=1 Tax=Bythopirellula polymerisocia TaxID=2528003 RepID=A0A5C6CWT7_9BACT|nr:cyclopropane-fatty-acyl-phospholipid synthase family protein [Bythopirellula polymerisocia]TWU27476.1 Cyclopropane-fatty-acyl-phospholipid synthase [Bythopirellula polymerisocia]
MLEKITQFMIRLAEAGWLPDWLLRLGIRGLLKKRLQVSVEDSSSAESANREFAERMRNGPLLEAASEANEQHYEVPSDFFRKVLGSHLKYSCALWESGATKLDRAEEAMLELTCKRAEIEDGMKILELGCGWGSLSLWLAENYPLSQIVAVSNSHSQREFIEAQCEARGLANLQVVTCNVAEFDTPDQFDRIVSVEMFEHFRNHALLLERIASWLSPAGKLFVHVFCHRETPYCFESNSSSDWMAQNFFTGGIMPSVALLVEYDEHLSVESQWNVNGINYSRTCEAWLKNLDTSYNELLPLFSQETDRTTAKVRLQKWRMFFLACSELFRYRGGNEWLVAHYLMKHSSRRS